MDLEIRRQIFHIICGNVFAALIFFDIVNGFILGLILVIGILLSLIYKKVKIPVIHWFLRIFDREKDIKRFPGKGSLFYLAGIFLVYIIFIGYDKNIVVASILILAFGDAVPHFIAPFSRIKHPFSNLKFLEAAFVGFFVAFLAAVNFVSPLEALLGSFFAMVVEGIDMKIGLDRVDDNLTMPIVAGVVIWIVRVLV